MNLPVIKRPNNFIFHDRLNFKCSGSKNGNVFRHETDESRSMTSPASDRRLRAIQRRCYIVLCGACVQAMHCIQQRGTATIHSVTQQGLTRIHVICTNAQIFISPAIMAYNRPLICPKKFLIMYFYNIQCRHQYYLKHIRFNHVNC